MPPPQKKMFCVQLLGAYHLPHSCRRGLAILNFDVLKGGVCKTEIAISNSRYINGFVIFAG